MQWHCGEYNSTGLCEDAHVQKADGTAKKAEGWEPVK